MILAYKKQTIVVEENQVVFNYLIKKTQYVKYKDIRCILVVPLNNMTNVVLIDKKFNRITTLNQMLVNYEALYNALIDHEIDLIDFGELVEQNKDVSKYVPSLNWIEKNYYKSIFNEDTTIKKMAKAIEKEKVASTKKFLKTLGWLLIIADVIAFFAGGKIMVILYTFVILITYAVYVKYYPYIFIEVATKKGQEQAYQLPFIGAGIALILLLNLGQLFNYDYGSFLKMMAIITLLLVIPFLIKSSKADVKQRFARKLSVIFAASMIAFTITFPINFLLTFDKSTHETVIVTDKHISGTKHRHRNIYVEYYNGEKETYEVTGNEYKDIQIGDIKRICNRKSALGLEYSTIHD